MAIWEARPLAEKLLLGAVVVVSVHLAILSDHAAGAAALVYAYLALMSCIAAARTRGRKRWGLALAGAGCIGIAALAAGGTQDRSALAVVAPPLFGYLLVSAYFAESLLPGRTPVILRIARVAHELPLSAKVEQYTKRLTQVWAVLPALLAVASVLVLWRYGLQRWSWTCNMLNPLVMMTVFLGEHAYRFRQFPELGPPSLVDTCRAMFKAHVR